MSKLRWDTQLYIPGIKSKEGETREYYVKNNNNRFNKVIENIDE